MAVSSPVMPPTVPTPARLALFAGRRARAWLASPRSMAAISPLARGFRPTARSSSESRMTEARVTRHAAFAGAPRAACNPSNNGCEPMASLSARAQSRKMRWRSSMPTDRLSSANCKTNRAYIARLLPPSSGGGSGADRGADRSGLAVSGSHRCAIVRAQPAERGASAQFRQRQDGSDPARAQRLADAQPAQGRSAKRVGGRRPGRRLRERDGKRCRHRATSMGSSDRLDAQTGCRQDL